MSGYKLTYYDLKGWAEPSRLIFALAKVPYEDVRLPYTHFAVNSLPEEIKPKLPYGQVPILEFDGVLLSQSHAIARFLAKRYGFYGKNDVESAKIDEIMDAVKDYVQTMRAILMSSNDESREAAKKHFVEIATPKYAGKFDSLLQNSGTFLVGHSVSVADLVLFCILDFVEHIGGLDLKTLYPNIAQFVKRVEAIPEILEWLQKRPSQPF